MSDVVIIDYGTGNVRSVFNSLNSAISEKKVNKRVTVSDELNVIKASSHIILPGVGSFKACLSGLKERPGLLSALNENVNIKMKPFLGICVGMQMLANKGFEGGEADGLGWIQGKVDILDSKNDYLKIPHIGWNNLKKVSKHPFLNFIKENNQNEYLDDNSNAYFVHSYGFDVKFPENKILVTDYGQEITAMVGKKNIIGTQFHPEKSQNFGQNFLTDFILWDGK